MSTPVPDEGVDWEALRRLAVEAMRTAYVPYSGYPVGAAALTTDGRLFTGCNVENAAYGVTLCAECGLVSSLVRDGGGRLASFCCVDAEGTFIVPCGRCRQLLWEHGGADLRVRLLGRVWRMDELLPDAFGVADLEKVAGRELAGGEAKDDHGENR